LPEICNFDNGQADNPETPQDGSKYTMGNVLKNEKIVRPPFPFTNPLTDHPQAASLSQENRANRKYISKIDAALKLQGTPSSYTYTDRDIILYNLSLGATRTDLPLVYEHSPSFQVLPTFGIVPTYHSTQPYSLKEIVPNFDMRKLLHGEQYLEIKHFPIPTAATLETTTKLVEVVDKGNAALVRRASITVDKATGKEVFYNESLSFIRGAGGFGGQRQGKERGAATAENKPPAREPDRVVEERIGEEVAALYRLMGDRNPLHIDPEFSKVGGFEVPILHGLATFGVSGKHVFREFGMFRSLKVRFAGVVLPGQTVVTEMWKEGAKVVYQVKVKETGKLCISGAGAELVGEQSKL
jgi:multifunctional beta-oxidation protein